VKTETNKTIADNKTFFILINHLVILGCKDKQNILIYFVFRAFYTNFAADLNFKRFKMKKLFTYMTIFAAMTMMMSCSKDEKEPVQVSKDITGKDWQGYMDTYKGNNGAWKNMDERSFVVIRFNGAANALKGDGYQLEFKNSTMSGDPSDKSAFRWEIENGELHIAYTAGWTDVWIDYNNCTVTSETFNGDMYDHNEHKYTFWLKAGVSIDWTKYFN